jgi:kinesin family protein 5
MSSVGIRVAVRFRPVSERESRELQSGDDAFPFIVNRNGVAPTVSLTGGTMITAPFEAAFDNVFDSYSTQEELFEYIAKPTVIDVLHGYNGTILAYGQTGSGKVHFIAFLGVFVSMLSSSIFPALSELHHVWCW